jgi:hypothetical protein
MPAGFDGHEFDGRYSADPHAAWLQEYAAEFGAEATKDIDALYKRCEARTGPFTAEQG